MTYSDSAIILKRFPYGEGDFLITLLSANRGKFTALAKGVRKINSRRGAHLDLFNHVKASFYSGRGSLDIITEVKTLDDFEGLRSSLDKIQLAFYFCELADNLLPENEKNYSTYKLLTRALEHLATAGDAFTNKQHTRRVSSRFGQAMLKDLGYRSPSVKSLDDEVDNETNINVIIESIIEKKLQSLRMQV